jgi:hypothetical protein
MFTKTGQYIICLVFYHVAVNCGLQTIISIYLSHLPKRENVLPLLILDLGTRGNLWSASRPGRPLPPGKLPPVLIGQEAGWAPESVWTERLELKSFAPAGDRTSFAR